MYIVGHRGAMGLAPENTLASIQKAIDFLVDEIEIDVRLTNDDVVVLMHDKTMKRLTGHDLKVSEHSYAELKAIKPDLTTLDEAITLIDRRIPLRIEVKPSIPVQAIVKTLRRYLKTGWKPSDFLLASFSQKTLLDLQHELPQIEKIIHEHFLSIRARHRARQLHSSRLVMSRRFIWFGFVRAISRTYKLSPYVMNDPSKAKGWQRHGLYGVVTDYPDRFKDLRDE
jgi:glycerophosphoryl diester phosphodiesterase